MNIEKYNKCFVDTFDVGVDVLNNEFKFGVNDGWDSLAHMTLIAALEDAFDIMFETEDIIHFGSYENGKKLLAKYGVFI